MSSTDLVHPATGEVVCLASGDTFTRMIGRAMQALDNARTLADTVRAMKLAQAAKELAKIANAANAARGDCLRIEVLAQIRIVEEYDAAQQRGEVAGEGGDHRSITALSADSDRLPTLEDLDLDRRRMSEWRDMARAGEDAALQVISDALDHGREPTKAAVRRAIKEGVGINALRAFSGNNEYYTPARYIEAARGHGRDRPRSGQLRHGPGDGAGEAVLHRRGRRAHQRMVRQFVGEPAL
jgi:hypothetical protein